MVLRLNRCSRARRSLARQRQSWKSARQGQQRVAAGSQVPQEPPGSSAARSSSTTPVSLVDPGGRLRRFLHAGAPLGYSQTQKNMLAKKWLLGSLSWARKSSPPRGGGGTAAGAGSPMPAPPGLLRYRTQGCAGKHALCSPGGMSQQVRHPRGGKTSALGKLSKKVLQNKLGGGGTGDTVLGWVPTGILKEALCP